MIKMCVKHLKICYFAIFYAEIVKLGLILTQLLLFFEGGGRGGKIFWGKYPHAPVVSPLCCDKYHFTENTNQKGFSKPLRILQVISTNKKANEPELFN